ncbi:unnamed protein product [Pleuronectes platessa]|uniref:Protein kinase domain-containing protein n=1 Tax=Pleuronectes platessa TaxID=8262 RepID=A0A9N7U184_PLEPL|nr:unnamed protein product [Pleuronectes platessa]
MICQGATCSLSVILCCNTARRSNTSWRLRVSYPTPCSTMDTPEEYRKDTEKHPIENRCWKFTSLDGLLHTRPISSHNFEDKVAEMADGHMFVDMLKAMLQLDPDRRITPRQVLEHNSITMRHYASMDH